LDFGSLNPLGWLAGRSTGEFAMSTADLLLSRPAADRKGAAQPALPLAGWSEAAVLSLIGASAPPFAMGTSTGWHKRAASLPEKRLVERLATVVHGATDFREFFAQRVAIAGANAAAAHPPAPLRDLIAAAVAGAVAAIDFEVDEVVGRLAAIRARRSRAALDEISAKRRELCRAFDAAERAANAAARALARRGRTVWKAGGDPFFDAEWAALRARHASAAGAMKVLTRAIDKLPSRRLSPKTRFCAFDFKRRLTQLRRARRALRAFLRELGRAAPRRTAAA
jgi:hypothetical protein